MRCDTQRWHVCDRSETDLREYSVPDHAAMSAAAVLSGVLALSRVVLSSSVLPMSPELPDLTSFAHVPGVPGVG